MKRMRVIAAMVLTLAVGTHAKPPTSLRVSLEDAGGPPTVTPDTVAVEKGRLGSACRQTLSEEFKSRLKTDEVEQLAKELDACTVWVIWDKLPQPATDDQLTAARVEIRNVGALRGKNIDLTRVRCTLPVAGVGEQALLCLLTVGVDLKNGRGLTLGEGKVTGVNIDGGLKALAKPPGVHLRPTTGPAATSQPMKTY